MDSAPATPDRPAMVIWELTYACQLRCTHCYTESGRRPPSHLGRDGLLRMASILGSMQLDCIVFCGGEPLLVREVFELAAHLHAHSPRTRLALYTNGIAVGRGTARQVVDHFDEIHLSIDGATAEVHDRIRGVPGSFEQALRALHVLREATRAEASSRRTPELGIDVTLVRSNFEQLPLFCSELPRHAPDLDFLSIGPAVPSGAASAVGFAETELLLETQLDVLRDEQTRTQLRALAPPSVRRVQLTDNLPLQFHPDHVRSGRAATQALEVEPDGSVRGMLVYEGVVGNLLTDAPELLWARAKARVSDPFVTATLAQVRTFQDWAAATRAIDARFASASNRPRVDRHASR